MLVNVGDFCAIRRYVYRDGARAVEHDTEWVIGEVREVSASGNVIISCRPLTSETTYPADAFAEVRRIERRDHQELTRKMVTENPAAVFPTVEALRSAIFAYQPA